jgi:hypothetical protein
MPAWMPGLLPLTIVTLVAVGAAGCAGTPPTAVARDWPLVAITEHDVTVALRATVDTAGQTWMAATFTPTRAGFHLYAKELPRDGLSGIGRPTLLEVSPYGPLTARGALVADGQPEPLHVEALNLSFPVYPAGPVTLRLPVAVVPGTARRATLLVTYLACSDSVCLAPVTRKPILVTLPDAYLPKSHGA